MPQSLPVHFVLPTHPGLLGNSKGAYVQEDSYYDIQAQILYSKPITKELRNFCGKVGLAGTKKEDGRVDGTGLNSVPSSLIIVASLWLGYVHWMDHDDTLTYNGDNLEWLLWFFFFYSQTQIYIWQEL